MGTQSRTSFKKRQKELARQEKQRDKAAKRLERKHAPKSPGDDALGEEMPAVVDGLGSDAPPSLSAEE